MKVLAVDPGPHVGVAYWEDRIGIEATDSFRAWEETPDGLYGMVDSWVAGVDVVVCEGFKIGGSRASEANVTIEMIGVLRYFAALHGKEFVEQTPADAKAFTTRAKLDRLGWWTKGSDHARSATRHLVLFLAGRQLLTAADLLESDSEVV